MGIRRRSSIVLFRYILLSLICACISSKSVHIMDNVTLIVLGNSRPNHRPETDENFVCATLDWWPATKCDFGQCPWGNASILNLNLQNKILTNAIRAFGGLRIRLGGSLQDQVVYQVGNHSRDCHSFERDDDGLFGFSKGCLGMKRWDELNKFFNKTGALITFGLNALVGRKKDSSTDLYRGEWDFGNALDFMNYTANKGYKIDSYEFGNELSGDGICAKVEAEQYGKDMILLKNITTTLYPNHRNPPPAVTGPGGFYQYEWFNKFLNTTRPNIVDALTYHFYNLGSGNKTSVIDDVLDPKSVDASDQMYQDISNDMEIFQTNIWVSESGGAFTSGSKNVSPSFADGLWYLNQLGLASKYGHKVFCRQTLIGGNYGLLDVNSFQPNPDYYGALLFNQLMGKVVLTLDERLSNHVGSNDTHLRVYAHCSKNVSGITILLINMSKSRTFQVNIQNYTNTNYTREEYHLSANHDNILSQEVLLNGKLLNLTESSDIPEMKPKFSNGKSNMTVSPYSIVFATLKSFNAAVCS